MTPPTQGAGAFAGVDSLNLWKPSSPSFHPVLLMKSNGAQNPDFHQGCVLERCQWLNICFGEDRKRNVWESRHHRGRLHSKNLYLLATKFYYCDTYCHFVSKVSIVRLPGCLKGRSCRERNWKLWTPWQCCDCRLCMLGECCQLDHREVSYKKLILCDLSNLMMVTKMTMMLNADKMTISGRVWSLRGQGGGEGGSRLTFRLMAVVMVAMVAMVAMVVGVTMMVMTKMLLVTFMSRCHFDQAQICKCCIYHMSEILEQLNQHWVLVLT